MSYSAKLLTLKMGVVVGTSQSIGGQKEVCVVWGHPRFSAVIRRESTLMGLGPLICGVCANSGLLVSDNWCWKIQDEFAVIFSTPLLFPPRLMCSLHS